MNEASIRGVGWTPLPSSLPSRRRKSPHDSYQSFPSSSPRLTGGGGEDAKRREEPYSGQKTDIGQQAVVESKSHLFFLLFCPLFVQHAVLCGDLLAKQIVFPSSEAMIWRQKRSHQIKRDK